MIKINKALVVSRDDEIVRSSDSKGNTSLHSEDAGSSPVGCVNNCKGVTAVFTDQVSLCDFQD